MSGLMRRHSAIAITLTLALAGCTASPARPAPTAMSAPPGPTLQGRIVVFSPDDHTIRRVTGSGPDTTITADAVVADLSPDRKTLAYVKQDTQLVLRNLASGAEQTITISADHAGLNVAPGCLHWSPDGRRLDFIAVQDGGLYVTTPAGVATRVDAPKHATYVQRNGKFIFGPPDPGAPTFAATSQLTCGQWLDTRRLVFDRVAKMPSVITVEQGKPAEVPPDTTTVAILAPIRLIDSPQRWVVHDRCGTRILSRLYKDASITEYTEYVLDTTKLGDGDLARPGAVAPASGKLPTVEDNAFIADSCDVLVIDACDHSTDESCVTKRYSSRTGVVQDLSSYDLHRGLVSPHLVAPGTAAWNPAGTQFATVGEGSVYLNDLGTGASTLVPGDRGGGYRQILGWLPD
jgi:hypothetical protein